jgi:hypothetical protein
LTYKTGIFDTVDINIGDYIQSIAAAVFYDSIDVYIEREELDSYNDAEKEIKIILNGWFMHQPENWPPANKIIPKIISFHINPDRAWQMLTPAGVRYFRKYSPIGCRDYWTKKILQQYKIPCYFSGCLTLVLGSKYKREYNSKRIYFVDPPIGLSFKLNKITSCIKLVSYIPETILHLYKIIRIHKNQKKSIFHAILFYHIYRKMFSDEILLNCEFISHIINRETLPHDNERFEYAESLVKKYANALLVVTSRIHCALPCIGLETPVIFIARDLHDKRLGGIKELFRIIRYSSGKLINDFDAELKEIKGKITQETRIENKKGYSVLKEQLENECKEFMKE